MQITLLFKISLKLTFSDDFETFSSTLFNQSGNLSGQQSNTKIYKILTLNDSASLSACKALCYLEDSEACKFLISNHPNCYLGDPMINSTTVLNDSSNQIAYGNYGINSLCFSLLL